MNIIQDIEDLSAEYESNPTFEKLAYLRSIMIISEKANKTKFKKLLTELYPDAAHFVYELLQNAQDASKKNATPSTVRFTLSENGLEFEHSGEKLFDISDIDAITNVGYSTKSDDNTSIGKFGIGFKSVFAYTNTPIVHSGEQHFKIEGLFIPERISVVQKGEKTVFELPFNNPDKDKAKAVGEIEKELRGLGSETLLFLKNIDKIEYLLPDGETLGYMECKKRDANDENIIEIRANLPGEAGKSSYWLRYTKEVSITDVIDGNEKSVTCSIAVAFKLEKNTTKERTEEWKIIRADPGKVCIFFPAAKETSKLYFDIHAPFASTVARDSVRDCEANDALRDNIAELIAESLNDIKKRGLLAIDFLAVLPNKQDELSDFYEPIRETIATAFQEQPLMPTKNGIYAPASKLLRGPAGISDVIDDEDLSLLTSRPTPLWAKNAPQQNQREDNFIDSLDIDKWSWKELHGVFNPTNDGYREKIEEWICKKPDAWLMKLYALLNNENLASIGEVDNNLRIVRTTKDKHVKAMDAYFVPDDNGDMPDELNFVKPESYKSGDAEKRKRDAEEFLEHKLRVRRYDEKEKVALRLKRYEENKPDIDEQYFADIRYFIGYSAKHPNDKESFQNEKFLRGEHNGAIDWVTPAQLWLTTPETESDVNV